jgi:cation channel sperm-associated protein 1
MIIIITHFIEIFLDLITETLGMSIDLSSLSFFKFLKSLRALRVLRAIKFLPNLQIIISTIIQSLMSISSIAALMLLFMFVFAVVGRELFREDDEKRFGNFIKTSLTLFQLLTLDDWGDILEDNGYKPLMFIYLFLYIVCEYFVFLNLFVAVLVDNFQMSIEAAQTVADVDEEEHKWNERLEDLLQEQHPENDAFRSRHKEAINELTIQDYMKVGKDSREAKLLSENLKKLAAIDFQYFMWNRRMRLASIVLEAATTERGISVGQANADIPPVDKIEPDHPDPSEMPLKPKRVPKKADDMLESNFQLKAKTQNKKTKRNTLIAETLTKSVDELKGLKAKGKSQGKDDGQKVKQKEKAK